MELTAEELQAIEVALDGFYPVSHSALVLKFRQMNYDIQKADLGEGPRPVVKREKREASLKPVYDKQTISDYIFDLDGVVLGPESEKFFQEHGLEAYMNYQKAMGHVPSSEGPALGILRKASAINQSYAGHTKPFNNHCVTAQGLWAAIRSIETFHAWGVDFNGTTHFLAGNDKLPVLKVLREQARQSGRSIEFYDDQRRNVEKGREAGILSGQVLDPDELHSS